MSIPKLELLYWMQTLESQVFHRHPNEIEYDCDNSTDLDSLPLVELVDFSILPILCN